jgi:hypothetical protein
MDNIKVWYGSKTLWFNVVTILLGVVQVVTDVYPIPTEYLALIMGTGNVLLRFITSKKIVL